MTRCWWLVLLVLPGAARAVFGDRLATNQVALFLFADGVTSANASVVTTAVNAEASSGFGDLTITNPSAVWNADRAGVTLAEDEVLVQSAPVTIVDGSYSIEMWFTITDASAYRPLLSLGAYATTSEPDNVADATTLRVQDNQVCAALQVASFCVPFTNVPGEPNHVVFVIEPAGGAFAYAKIYCGSSNFSAGLAFPSGHSPLRLGYFHAAPGEPAMGGEVLMLAMYDEFMTDEHVATNFAAGPPSLSERLSGPEDARIPFDFSDLRGNAPYTFTALPAKGTLYFEGAVYDDFPNIASAAGWEYVQDTADEFGNNYDTFKYGADSGVVLVVIDITPAPDAPTVEDASGTTYVGEPVIISLVATDPDMTCTSFSFVVDALPPNGELYEVCTNATTCSTTAIGSAVATAYPLVGSQVMYVPTGTPTGGSPSFTDAFNIAATDCTALTGAGTSIPISVVNDLLPVLGNATVAEDGNTTVTLNGTRTLPGSFGYQVSGLPSNGALLVGAVEVTSTPFDLGLGGTADVVYVPEPDFFGMDTMEFEMYTVPGMIASFSQTMELHVTPTPDVPVLTPEYSSYAAEAGEVVEIFYYLTDVDGDTHEYQVEVALAGSPAAMSLNPAANGTLSDASAFPNNDTVLAIFSGRLAAINLALQPLTVQTIFPDGLGGGSGPTITGFNLGDLVPGAGEAKRVVIPDVTIAVSVQKAVDPPDLYSIANTVPINMTAFVPGAPEEVIAPPEEPFVENPTMWLVVIALPALGLLILCCVAAIKFRPRGKPAEAKGSKNKITRTSSSATSSFDQLLFEADAAVVNVLAELSPSTDLSKALVYIFDGAGTTGFRLVTKRLEYEYRHDYANQDFGASLFFCYARMTGPRFFGRALAPWFAELMSSTSRLPASREDYRGTMVSGAPNSVEDSVQRLFDAVQSNVNDFPSPLAEVCKSVYSSHSRPEAAKLTRSLIFTEFFAAAIADPEGYGLTTGAVQPAVQLRLEIIREVLFNVGEGDEFDRGDTLFTLNGRVYEWGANASTFIETISNSTFGGKAAQIVPPGGALASAIDKIQNSLKREKKQVERIASNALFTEIFGVINEFAIENITRAPPPAPSEDDEGGVEMGDIGLTLTCPSCNETVQPDWKGCAFCGSRLDGEEAGVAAPASLGCTSCGANLQPGWKGCPTCGTPV